MVQVKHLHVCALVPAHNEQETIKKTLETLANQTYPLWKIILACDNCTDNTEAIASTMTSSIPQLRIIKTLNNPYKKAGALNQAREDALIQESGECDGTQIDLFLQMDADTVLYPNVVEMGVAEFLKEGSEELGGVGSRFFVAKPVEKTSFLGNILWHYQTIEYNLADADRVEGVNKPVRVLAGACCIYRRCVLDKVAALHPKIDNIAQVWEVDNIVEDLGVTNDVRAMGYETLCCHNMITVTHVPPTFRSYIAQRERWYLGTILELVKRGFKKYTTKDIMTHAFGILMIITRIWFYNLILYNILTHIPFTFNAFTLSVGITVPIATILYNWHRSMYLRVHRCKLHLFMYFSFFPMELYSILRDILMIRAYYLATFRKRHKW